MKYQLPKPVVALTVGLVVIVALGAVFHSAIDRQMHSWKLLPEPERLTELYFTDPNHLPSTYAPNQMQAVAFTVHNLEYQPVTYHYTIEQVSQNDHHKLPLSSGSFTLRQNGYAHLQPQITLGDLDRSRISITITPTNENISYWVKEI